MSSDFEEIQRAIDEIRKIKRSIASNGGNQSTAIKMDNAHDNYFQDIKIRGFDVAVDMVNSTGNEFVRLDAEKNPSQKNVVIELLERIEFMLEEMKAGKVKDNPSKIRNILNRLKDAGALSGAVYTMLANLETIKKILLGS